MPSLTEKAKSLKPKFANKVKFTQDEIDLALAFARGDVRLTQVSYAMGFKKNHSKTYIFLAMALSAFVSGR